LLFRAAWREMHPLRWRLLAVMLIMGAGFGMYAGIYSAIDSMFEARGHNYEAAGIAGFEVRFSPEDIINLPDFADIHGIGAYTARLLLPGNIELPDGHRLSALLVAVEAPQSINRLLMTDGVELDPTHPARAVIDRNLARHRGFGVGDPLVVNVGQDRVELEVGGIATSAEHLVDGADPSFFLPAKGSLGIVFVPLELMDERLGFRLVNSLLFTGEEVAADLPADAQAAIVERADRRLTIEDRLPLSRQFGHLFLNLDLNAFRIFTPAIVVIFGVSATTVLFFLLYQWITSQRRELGVLAALGYEGARLGQRVIGPVLLIAAGGLLAGLLFSLVLLYGFGFEYTNAIGLPPPRLVLFPQHVLVATLGLLVISVVGVAIPLHRIVKTKPIDAVRALPQVPPSGHGSSADAVGNLVWRHALRAMLRRRWVSLMTVLAVAAALAPALSYFVALRSFEQAVIDGFAKDSWQYSADFLSPVWDDELEGIRNLPGVTRLDPIVRGATRFENGDEREGALLIGIDSVTALRLPEVTEGRFLSADDTDAVVMERKLARSLGLEVGDSFTVDGRLAREPAQLVGVFSGALPGESFTTREAARRWLDLPEQNTGVLIATDPGAELTDPLYADTRIGKVTERGALVAEVLHHLHEIAAIVYLAAAFGIGVALLFLYTSTAFSFIDREGDFGLLALLGFERGQVAAMVRGELWLLGGAGILLSMPLGYGLAHWLNGVLSEAWFDVPTTFAIFDPMSMAVPALLLLPLIVRPVIRRIRTQDLGLLLRRRSFG
jgi:ABC-type lipoprotein release transport system permease subunit